MQYFFKNGNMCTKQVNNKKLKIKLITYKTKHIQTSHFQILCMVKKVNKERTGRKDNKIQSLLILRIVHGTI